ncbi:unnamed protein product [Calicophoron daubneyi]|uniref:Uncharacterized protein n=1 Tax=Calicophoron daubneyi TaxID=300641 RepID=A0AAV2SVP9_CALDB
MDSWDGCLRNPKRLAEYFVICGLPKEPRPYDLSKVVTHAEEIIIPDSTLDFTRFPEPITDIAVVNAKNKDQLPYGFHPITRSCTGKHKACVSLNKGEDVYIGFRRGRDKPPIKNISLFAESPNSRLKEGARKIPYAVGGESADFGSTLRSLYLCYDRASPDDGIDQIAVTDICIVVASKHESCPPAFSQVPEALNNGLMSKIYLCYRKSLVKQYIITYEPEVLFWYRVPAPTIAIETEQSNDHTGQHEAPQAESNAPPAVRVDVTSPLSAPPSESNSCKSLDPDICQVANFCLPWGASIESWSVDQAPPSPKFFTFVLTNESYQRLYGVAFTFHEPYDIKQLDMDKCYRLGIDPELIPSENNPSAEDAVTTEEVDTHHEEEITARQGHFLCARLGDRVIGVTKTICLLSRWSFPVAFTNFLAFLYSRCLPHAKNDPIPLERYLAYFLCEVPFPDQSTPNVRVQLCAAPIVLHMPDETNASSSDEPFFLLLDCLGVDVTIQLLVLMLTEQKILLTSIHHYLLTQIGEALTAMIFPLRWTVVYIPFVYMGCIHVIQSPPPYLIGVDSRFFDFFRLPPGGDVTCVDLDTGNYKPMESSGHVLLDSKMLPKKPTKQLKAELTKLHQEVVDLRRAKQNRTNQILFASLFSESGSQLADEEMSSLQKRMLLGGRIRGAFTRFMASLLKDYRHYLIPVRNAKRDVLFDAPGFIKESAEKHGRPFYQALFDTQHWANFVRDRTYASPRDEELACFDDYIDRLGGDSSSASGSQSLASSHGSLRGSGDGNSLLSRHGSQDEAAMFRMLSTQQIDSECTRIIEPPNWPLPKLATAGTGVCATNKVEQLTPTVTRTEHHSSARDLVPISLDTKLLDHLAAYAFRIRAEADSDYPTNSFRNLDWTDSGLIGSNSLLNPIGLDTNQLVADNGCGVAHSASSNSLPPQATDSTTSVVPARSRFARDPWLLGSSANPSPIPKRVASSGKFSLIGLPTSYPIPVPNHVILRRSPQELSHALEIGIHAARDGGLTWSRHIVASMYSLWFMLLPSCLSSIHAQLSLIEGMPTEVVANKISTYIQDAVKMLDKFRYYRFDFPDQVYLRVLLVLIFQNRPTDISLSNFLDAYKWNGSSIGIANHIYKACLKESKERERLAREQAHRCPVNIHRRSASLCCSPSELGTVQSAPDFVSLENKKASSNVLPGAKPQVEQNMTHRRSSSTATTGSLNALTTGSVGPAKSETDSGLILTTTGEEPEGESEHTTGPHSELPISRPVSSAKPPLKNNGTNHEHSTMSSAVVKQDSTAPLATADDLDLGYDTLSRPVDPVDGASSLRRQSDAGSYVAPEHGNSHIVEARGPPPSAVNPNHHEPSTTSGPVLSLSKSMEAFSLQSSEHAGPSRKYAALIGGGRNRSTGLVGRGKSESPSTSTAKEPRLDPTARVHQSPASCLPPVGRLTASKSSRSRRSTSRSTTSSSRSRSDSASPEVECTGVYRTEYWGLNTTPSGQSLDKPDSESKESYRDSEDTREGANDADDEQEGDPRPRGSLDYLSNALSNFGKSTSKFMSRLNVDRSFRGLFVGNSGGPIANNSPWSPRTSGRRATAGSLESVQTNPETGVLQTIRHWARTPVDGSARSHEENSADSVTLSYPKPTEFRLVNLKVLHDLMLYQDSWYNIAGPLAVGTPNLRCFPATTTGFTFSRSCRVSSPQIDLRAGNPSLAQRTPSRECSVSSFDSSKCSSKVPITDDTSIFAASATAIGANSGSAAGCTSMSSDHPSAEVSSPESDTVNARVTQLFVCISTCNLCPKCDVSIHDEEIMAAWSPDDTEQRIRCPFCAHYFVPQMTIRIIGEVDGSGTSATLGSGCSPIVSHRRPPPANLSETNRTVVSGRGVSPNSRENTANAGQRRTSLKGLMEFTHLYLSPFVLRKNLETVLQREEDDYFRVRSPKHSLLYRHESLTWNLVWHLHRLGLPNHLLDFLPVWMMDRQLDQRVRLTQGALTKRMEGNGGKIPDVFLQVQLSPDLPVMISLRWNAYQKARSMASKPFYKQWLRLRSERMPPKAVSPPMSPTTGPSLSPSELGISASSSCPMQATLARVMQAFSANSVRFAMDALIQFRISIYYNAPISTVIRTCPALHDPPAETPVSSTTVAAADVHKAPLTATSGKTSKAKVGSSSETRSRCSDVHHCDGSLYRELLFFALTYLPRGSFNVVKFDKDYSEAFNWYSLNEYSFVHPIDCPPSCVAAGCRQMLRGLSLIP